uniref:Uncharacterized protein n=1 Tax=Anguilla anguilla TaxID=7936 RepID=A0A0E9QH17_ANGAN
MICASYNCIHHVRRKKKEGKKKDRETAD